MGQRPGPTSDDLARLKALEREIYQMGAPTLDAAIEA